MKSQLVLILCLATLPWGHARPYPSPDVQQLYQHYLDVVGNIAVFDHHAHPGFADDPDVDAMAAPPGSTPFRERDTNPELVAAAKALEIAHAYLHDTAVSLYPSLAR